MGIFDSMIARDKEISTIGDVCDLIDKRVDQILKEIEQLTFATTGEADKRRTELVAQKGILIALKVAISAK